MLAEKKEESNQTLNLVPSTSVEPKRNDVQKRIEVIKKRIEISDKNAWILAHIFDSKFYRINYYKPGNSLSDIQLLEHYLTIGLSQNYLPSSLFDNRHTKVQLGISGEDSTDYTKETSVMFRWLESCKKNICPISYFNKNFYLSEYPDILDSNLSPYLHYMVHGKNEGRLPSVGVKNFCVQYSKYMNKYGISIAEILSLIPTEFRTEFFSKKYNNSLFNIFMEGVYSTQIRDNVFASKEDAFAHFVTYGLSNRMRPSALFNESYYISNVEKYIESKNSNISPKHEHEMGDKLRESLYSCPYLHWFFIGKKLNIIPTPLFDEQFYLTSHVDLRQGLKKFPFEHYVENGFRERHRKASSFFDSIYYLNQVKLLRCGSAIEDYMVFGQKKNLVPAHDLSSYQLHDSENKMSSSLEELAITVCNKVQKLNSGVLAKMIKHATDIEPLIVRPFGYRRKLFAPIFHQDIQLLDAMRNVKSDLANFHYKTVVLIPHCRMAGSARVAGTFLSSIIKFQEKNDVLVVLTDRSEFERADWFPDDLDIFDLNIHINKFPPETKVRALLDLVRGVRAERIININSKLCWQLTDTYGRQISSWMDIYCYLFTWDLDVHGNKGGYPIQWFLPTFNYVKKVFVDNSVLKQELVSRYSMSSELEKKIVTLHTPAIDTDISYRDEFNKRFSSSSVKRCIWAGRFDRQKRIDIVIEVAKAMPEVEFWLWGKKVLCDDKTNMNNLPSNIKLMGTYTDLDDLPIASCDFFFYTAAWDGLPTILIDIAVRGIPVVSSAVGGVTDLLNDDTGWLVKKADDPDSYVDSINSLLSNKEKTLERAANLRTAAIALCDEEKYTTSLRKIIG